jgi:hypothetical protein
MATFRFVKPTICIYFSIIFILGYLPISIAIYYGTGSFTIKISIFIVMTLSFVILSVYIYNRKIVIDEKCITYYSMFNEYKILWSDVKEIGITKFYLNGQTKDFLYFSTEEQISSITFNIEINDKIIYLRNRKSLIREINKYWNCEIKGLIS